jgi:hypothetical protein
MIVPEVMASRGAATAVSTRDGRPPTSPRSGEVNSSDPVFPVQHEKPEQVTRARSRPTPIRCANGLRPTHAPVAPPKASPEEPMVHEGPYLRERDRPFE